MVKEYGLLLAEKSTWKVALAKEKEGKIDFIPYSKEDNTIRKGAFFLKNRDLTVKKWPGAAWQK